MKRSLSFSLLFAVLLFLIVSPARAFQSAAAGLMLWFHTLLPTLLPFMILSNLIIKTDILKKWLHMTSSLWYHLFRLSENGAYALFLGILCGYPMGTKITADLYRENKISKKEAEYLLTFSSYPSLSFLSSYICLQTFNEEDLFLPVCMIVYASGFICSLFFRWKSDVSRHICEQKKAITQMGAFGCPFTGTLIDTSIMNSFESITKLGGYIILFSILQEMQKNTVISGTVLSDILCGITEISTGITSLAHAGWPFSILFPFIIGLASHGGLCIAAQSKSMLSETDLNFAYYLLGKFCCFVFSFAAGVLFIKISV